MTYVSGASAYTGSTGLSFSKSVTAGDVIVFVVGSNSNPVTFSNVGDGVNTYQVGYGPFTDSSSGPFTTTVYWAVASTSGTLTFVATASSSQNFFFGLVAEFANGATSGLVDQYATATNSATASPQTGTTAQTSQANEMLISLFSSTGSNQIATPSGWTCPSDFNNPAATVSTRLFYKFVTSEGAYSGASTNGSGTCTGTGMIVTLKAK